MTVLSIEEVACQVAVEEIGGLALRPNTKTAVESAENDEDAAAADRRRVECTEAEARELLQYFGYAAAALEVRGDYERSTVCAHTAEQIRRIVGSWR